MKQVWRSRITKEMLSVLLLSSGVSVGLLVVRILVTGSFRLSFLVWNLFLAWIPLFFGFWLSVRLRVIKIIDWQELLIGLLWLFFLPNTFYIITDLIHLQSSGEVSLLYDTAMITSFVINGLILGYVSLYMVHKSAVRLLGKWAHWLAHFVLLLCSFAIYLGRYLRWNTWDVVVNPAGLVFDVSDRIINPSSYMHTFVITGIFYILLGSTYVVIYKLASLLQITKSK